MTLWSEQISSLYKIRSVSDLPEQELSRQTVLRGEHFSYQIILRADCNVFCRFSARAFGPDGAENEALTAALRLYRLRPAAMDYPVYPDHDEDILTDEPGLMPDILEPLEESSGMLRLSDRPASVLLSLDTPLDAAPGDYEIRAERVYFEPGTPEILHTETSVLTLHILSAALPAQSVHFTQWFHVDSIAEAYHVPVYSEAHWELIGKYMQMARYLGIDTILTPMLTPSLDTLIGGERLCVQLVQIEKHGERYAFDFSRAARYIDLAHENGIRRFEIAHLYSQWGMTSAPNIYVRVDGREEHLFGWHTPAQSEAYQAFLKQLLPAMLDFLTEKGVLEDSFFHISDEPGLDHLETYHALWRFVKPMLRGRPIMDAISNVDFYKHGLIDIPVSATDHIEPFLREPVENQWAYYCCGEYKAVGNRFLAFPEYRNRILGVQLFKFDIKGFLQWGYNFYHADRSMYVIDPYLTSSGDGMVPSGDPFSVYPGKDGPVASLRALNFKDALQDVDILKALAQRTPHEHVVELIEKLAGMEIRFDKYPRNYEFIPALMDAVRQELEAGTC